MAKRKPVQESVDTAKLQRIVAQYEQVFEEVEHFIGLINRQEEEIRSAQEVVYRTKEKYEAARDELAAAREARDGTKHALFMFLRPGPAEILPLFDRMEKPDEGKHGANATEWRKEPVSALRLSLESTNFLTAADVILVGQLQDRVLAKPENWWEEIVGLTAPKAAAIADRLSDFIAEHSGK